MTEEAQEQEAQEQSPQEQQAAPEQSEKDQWIPKSRFDQINAQKKQADEKLETVAAKLAEAIPEKYRDLVPKDMPAAQKIDWIQNAQAKGIFDAKAAESPASETPGPGNTKIDFNNMSSDELMAYYHNNNKY